MSCFINVSFHFGTFLLSVRFPIGEDAFTCRVCWENVNCKSDLAAEVDDDDDDDDDIVTAANVCLKCSSHHSSEARSSLSIRKTSFDKASTPDHMSVSNIPTRLSCAALDSSRAFEFKVVEEGNDPDNDSKAGDEHPTLWWRYPSNHSPCTTMPAVIA